MPTKVPALITTPIFYVNASPHIGHLYTAVLSDAIARWHRLQGAEVLFTSGTDEHGLKVHEAAEKQGHFPYFICPLSQQNIKVLVLSNFVTTFLVNFGTC